jgi:hypothetical protein
MTRGRVEGVSKVLQPRQVPLKRFSMSSLHTVHIRWPQITSMLFSSVVSTFTSNNKTKQNYSKKVHVSLLNVRWKELWQSPSNFLVACDQHEGYIYLSWHCNILLKMWIQIIIRTQLINTTYIYITFTINGPNFTNHFQVVCRKSIYLSTHTHELSALDTAKE